MESSAIPPSPGKSCPKWHLSPEPAPLQGILRLCQASEPRKLHSGPGWGTWSDTRLTDMSALCQVFGTDLKKLPQTSPAWPDPAPLLSQQIPSTCLCSHWAPAVLNQCLLAAHHPPRPCHTQGAGGTTVLRPRLPLLPRPRTQGYRKALRSWTLLQEADLSQQPACSVWSQASGWPSVLQAAHL